MIKKFCIYIFVFFCCNNVYGSFYKMPFVFGIECNSIKNYFEIDLLPVNLIDYGSLFLNKYKNNEKNLCRQKMLNVTKHFLNYLKEINVKDFSFVNGFSYFIGYKIDEYLSFSVGKTYGVCSIDIKICDFNEIFKNSFINGVIGQCKYSYESTWLDFVKTLLIEKSFFILLSFGFEIIESSFNFLSDKNYEFYNNIFLNDKNFNMKKFENNFSYEKKYNFENKKFIPYTFAYKKNEEQYFDKKSYDMSCSKICMNKLLKNKFFAKKKCIRFGFGVKSIINSKLHLNISLRYHFFIKNYNYIKFFNTNALSTNLSFVYNY